MFVLGEESAWGTWVDWVQGVTVALREDGHDLPGFDLLVRSDVRCDMGLGSSTALVVSSVGALEANAARVKGRIVVFNVPYTSYGETRPVRTNGASRAARGCVRRSSRPRRRRLRG